MTAPARAAILSRTREALARARRAAGRLPVEPPPAPAPDFAPFDRLERFRRILESVGGRVWTASDDEGPGAALERIVAAAGATRIAVSDAPVVLQLVRRLAGERSGVEVVPWSAGRAALVETDLGVSCAQWGIAETGSLVLESAREHHRLVSLVPPIHVALLPRSAILGTLGEALDVVRVASGALRSRAVTLITGPSRTADIELTLVVGVHGPKELHVILTPEERP